jgi:hypothetical protein
MDEAIGELNQTKELVQRIEMDIFRTSEELKRRPIDEGSDNEVVIDEAPPDEWRSRTGICAQYGLGMSLALLMNVDSHVMNV